MPARLIAPSLGAPESAYLQPGDWVASVSYRYLHSFRDFHGSEELPVPAPVELYAYTWVHGFDFTLTYALTERFSLTLEIPAQYGVRKSPLEHDLITRRTMRAGGLGDIRLVGSVWLLNPEQHEKENIALGLGVKAPTGEYRATDYSYRETGRILRPVDMAIQPGDGGWGILLEMQAFKELFKNSFAFLQGLYLVNPREMNGTETPFGDRPEITGGDIGYTINSVPDQYLARGGVAQTIWPAAGLSLILGARIEGVPVRDLIGGSQGYRATGYAISIEPGFAIVKGDHVFTFTAPVAVERHANKSLADRRTGNPFGGTAAFADFLISASYSLRF